MSAASNNGSIFGGVTTWATSSGISTSFSLARSAGSLGLQIVAELGKSVAKEIFEDDNRSSVSSSSQDQPVSASRGSSAAYASLPREAKIDMDFRIRRLREDLGLPAERPPEEPVPSAHGKNEDPLEDDSLKMVGVIGAVVLGVHYMTKASKKAVPVKVAAQTSWLPSSGKILFTAGAVAVAWFAVKPQLEKIPQFQKFMSWLDSV